MLHPAPGLITAYDEHACLVVDTRRDEWIHFTGPQAWAWETVQVTGSPNSLDEVEQGCVISFLRCGLLVESQGGLSRVIIPTPPPDRIEGPLPRSKSLQGAVRSARRWALKLSRKSLGEALRTVENLHATPSPWADPETARTLYELAAVRPKWIPDRLHTTRMVCLTTVLAAALAGRRLEWVLAFSHEAEEPREWCRSLEVEPGFTPGCLEIHSV